METRGVEVIPLENFSDARGHLVSATGRKQIPFDIKRVFFIYGNDHPRGGHAHKKCEQFLIPVLGVIQATINGVPFVLSFPDNGIYVPINHKVDLAFSPGSILLVVASEEYDVNDYIQ